MSICECAKFCRGIIAHEHTSSGLEPHAHAGGLAIALLAADRWPWRQTHFGCTQFRPLLALKGATFRSATPQKRQAASSKLYLTPTCRIMPVKDGEATAGRLCAVVNRSHALHGHSRRRCRNLFCGSWQAFGKLRPATANATMHDTKWAHERFTCPPLEKSIIVRDGLRRITLNTKREVAHANFSPLFPSGWWRTVRALLDALSYCEKASHEARTNKPNFFEIPVGEVGETKSWSSKCAWTCNAANMQLCSSSDAAQFSLRKTCHYEDTCSSRQVTLHTKREVAHANFSPLFPSGWWRTVRALLDALSYCEKAPHEARTNKPPSARLEATLQRALGQLRGQAGEQLLELRLVIVGLRGDLRQDAPNVAKLHLPKHSSDHLYLRKVAPGDAI